MRIIKKKLLSSNRVESELVIYAISDSHMKDGFDGRYDLNGAYTTKKDRLYFQAQQKLRKFVEITNTDEPDFAIHLGDFFDPTPPFDFFKIEFDKITVEKSLIIGNHDVEYKGSNYADDCYDECVEKLGITTSEIAGSRFNTSRIISSGDLKVKILTLDCTLKNDENGNVIRHNNWVGIITLQELEWLKTELSGDNFDCCVIANHFSMDTTSYFNQDDVAKLQNCIRESTSKPVYCIYGHHHTLNSYVSTKFNPQFTSVKVASIIFGGDELNKRISYFTKITITKNGIKVDDIPIEYDGELPEGWE